MTKVVLTKSEEFLASLLSECKVKPAEPIFIDGKQVQVVRDKNGARYYVCNDGHLYGRENATLSTHHHFKKGLISHCNKLCNQLATYMKDSNPFFQKVQVTYKHRKGLRDGTDVIFTITSQLPTTDGYLVQNDYQLMHDFAIAFRTLVKSKSLYY